MKTLSKITDVLVGLLVALVVWIALLFFLGASWTAGVIAFKMGGACLRYLLRLIFNL